MLLAHWIYHNDRLSHAKIWGCVVGFAGVMLVNLGRGTLDLDFTLLGEGFVVIAAFVLAAASIYGKQVSQRMDSMVATGWQLALGGAALLAIGWGLGARSPASPGSPPCCWCTWRCCLRPRFFRCGACYSNTTGQPGHGVQLLGAGVWCGAVSHLLGEALLEWKNLLALVLVRGHLAGNARCPGPQGIRPSATPAK